MPGDSGIQPVKDAGRRQYGMYWGARGRLSGAAGHGVRHQIRRPMLGASLPRPHAASACGLLVALALALALAGCAARTNSAVTVSGTTLTVYASQPPGGGGQTAADVLDAEQLALQQNGRSVGKFTVRLVKLDGKEISDNARRAVQNSTAIAYLGE